MRILVLSVHPDDETLGCGGTILKHSAQADDLYWLIVTGISENLGYSQDLIADREKQIETVAEAYRFQRTYRLDLPTTQLHLIDFNELISRISGVIEEVRPETIYTVNRSDVHTDHQIVARALASSTKSFRKPYVKRILMYECISETDAAPPLPESAFLPNVYSDISAYIERKIEVMQIYESELHRPPLPRSAENITALARFRGSTIAVDYAEAFMLTRDVF